MLSSSGPSSLCRYPWAVRKISEYIEANRDGVGRPLEVAFQSIRTIEIVVTAFLSMMYLASGTYNPFIYFRF